MVGPKKSAICLDEESRFQHGLHPSVPLCLNQTWKVDLCFETMTATACAILTLLGSCSNCCTSALSLTFGVISQPFMVSDWNTTFQSVLHVRYPLYSLSASLQTSSPIRWHPLVKAALNEFSSKLEFLCLQGFSFSFVTASALDTLRRRFRDSLCNGSSHARLPCLINHATRSFFLVSSFSFLFLLAKIIFAH